MQPNQIVLAVDPENDGTTVNETYLRYEEYQNRAAYIGANHAPDDRDIIALYRTFPTKSGNFKGVSKTSVKLTRDVEVPGVDSSTTLTAPVIIEVSFSVPVGTDPLIVKHCRQRAIAMEDLDSVMDPLNNQLVI